MKKFFRSIALSTIAIAVIVGNAMAYQLTLDVSGERTQSRNATQGSIKAAYYNPAGLVNLPEGFHVDLGNRILYLKTTTEVSPVGLESESETWTTLLPNAAVAWRIGGGALFLTFDIREGGAGGFWNDVASMNLLGYALNPAGFGMTAGTNSLLTLVELSTYTYGVTLGGAFRLADWLAVSGGIRYLQKNSSGYFEGLAVAGGLLYNRLERSAYGYQGILGAMITPMQGLNIALNFTSMTVKTGKTEKEMVTGFDLAAEAVEDWSPAMLAFGVGYTVAQGVEVQLSYNCTFNGESSYAQTFRFDRNNDADHAFGLGTEYKLMDLLTVSFGLSYHITGTSESQNIDPTDPSFDKMVIGAGAVISPMEGLQIDLGLSYQIFFEADGTNNAMAPAVMTHNRDAFVMGLGIAYSL
jgi:long-chain fatty acid transport protein